MTYFRNHRRGLEKDRRCPALRPPELGENRRGAVRGASPFSAAYPLRGGYFPGGHGLGQPGAGVRCAGRIGPGAILVGAVAFFGRTEFHREAGRLLRPRPDQ